MLIVCPYRIMQVIAALCKQMLCVKAYLMAGHIPVADKVTDPLGCRIHTVQLSSVQIPIVDIPRFLRNGFGHFAQYQMGIQIVSAV